MRAEELILSPSCLKISFIIPSLMSLRCTEHLNYLWAQGTRGERETERWRGENRIGGTKYRGGKGTKGRTER